MKTPKFVLHDGSDRSPHWDDEFRCERPGVDVFSGIFNGGKQRREKHGWRIHAMSNAWTVSGSGYPHKAREQLRSIPDEYQVNLAEIERQIIALRQQFSAVLREAWEKGSSVHVSQAINYESEKAKHDATRILPPKPALPK